MGDQWIYESDDGDVAFEVIGREPVAGVDCFVVERTIGSARLRFYLSVAGDGVRIHRVGDDQYDPPFREFAFGTRKGDTWNWKGKIGSTESGYDCMNGGLEQVDVPFGKLRGFRITQNDVHRFADFSVVKGLGLVEVVGKHSDVHDSTPGPFHWRLKAFRRL